jgi:hypothetical protein
MTSLLSCAPKRLSNLGSRLAGDYPCGNHTRVWPDLPRAVPVNCYLEVLLPVQPEVSSIG